MIDNQFCGANPTPGRPSWRAPAAYRVEADRMIADRGAKTKRPAAGFRTPGDQPPPDPVIPRADHVLFLVLGSYPETGAADRDFPAGMQKGLIGELFARHFPLFNRDKAGPVVAGLYTHWLDRRTDTAVLRDGFQIVGQSLYRDLPGVLRTARRVLADRDHPPATRAAAALVIGRYGTTADLPALAALMDTEVEVASTTSKGVHFSTTAADVALGVSAWVTDGDLAGLGFPHVALFKGRPEKRATGERVMKFLADSQTGLSFYHFGFPDDRSRTAAHAKVRAWLAARGK